MATRVTRRGVGRLALALTVVLALAACGGASTGRSSTTTAQPPASTALPSSTAGATPSDPGEAPSEPGATDAPSDPAPPSMSAPPEQLQAAQRTPFRVLSDAPDGTIPTGWSYLGIDPTGTRLAISVDRVGGCQRLAGVVVAQTRTTVTLSPRLTVSQGGAACPNHVVVTMGYVALAEPLGSRRLRQAYGGAMP